MSWKFPDSNLVQTEVVSSEELNKGFMPAAQEAQGRINEHNLASGVVPPASFGANSFIPDTHVESSGVCLEYVNTRGSGQTSVEGGNGATRGAWITIDGVAGHNSYTQSPDLDGAVQIPMAPFYDTVGSKKEPYQRPVGESVPKPMSVSFFVETDTTLWIMATCQAGDFGTAGERFGSMFSLRVNGAIVTESIFGSADVQNDSIGYQSGGDVLPDAERKQASPSSGTSSIRSGYPVCCECVVDVPAGDVVVELTAVNVISLSGDFVDDFVDRMAVGSREIVILKMMG